MAFAKFVFHTEMQHYPNRKPRSSHFDLRVPSAPSTVISGDDENEIREVEKPKKIETADSSRRLSENMDSYEVQQLNLDRLFNSGDFDGLYEYAMKHSLQTPEEREEGNKYKQSGYMQGLYSEARQAVYRRIKAEQKLEALEAQKRRGGVPLIWRWSIGHYGGFYLTVPAENLAEFKARFPKGTFPKKIEQEPVEGIDERVTEAFDKLYKKSKGIRYRMYFGDRTKGEKILSDSGILQNESAQQPESYD
ncbi:MAG: hypothetical protein ACHQ03_11645 [Candidatus Bathyarchaeia archaeon]